MTALPPHDLALETALVVTCALDPALRALVTLRPDELFGSNTRAIANAVLSLEETGEAVDLVNIGACLRRMGRLGDVGDLRALADLFNETPTVAAVEDYAHRVADLARRRRLIDTCRRIAIDAQHDTSPDFFQRAEASIFEIATSGAVAKEDTCQRFGEIAERIFQRMSDSKPMKRIPTGLGSVDAILGGWRDGDLVIVAARPGMGKSAYAAGAATMVALHEDNDAAHAALIMSAEMSREEIVERGLAADARVDSANLQSHRLAHGEMDRLVKSASDLHWLPVWIDDLPSPTLLDVRSRVLRVKAELARWKRDDGKPTKLSLVVVDHLQIVGTKSHDNKTRSRELGEYTGGLKALAKTEKLCVMALSQLSREVEKRSDKRPTLSDLRDAGEIEQDADRVICLYREDYYVKNTKRRGIAEAIVRKARGGPTGTAFCKWTGAYTQFSELTASEEAELARESEEEPGAPSPPRRSRYEPRRQA